MSALAFTQSGDTITITHGGESRSYTSAQVVALAANLLAYYSDGNVEGLSVDVDIATTDSDWSKSPIGLPNDCCEYAPHRIELYQYILDQGFANITFAAGQVGEVDAAAITERWAVALDYDDLLAGFQATVAIREALEAVDLSSKPSRIALARTVYESCNANVMSNPLCDWIWSLALSEYAAPQRVIIAAANGTLEVHENKQEQCRLCEFYAHCHDENGCHKIVLQMLSLMIADATDVSALNQMRVAALATMPARESRMREILGIEE